MKKQSAHIALAILLLWWGSVSWCQAQIDTLFLNGHLPSPGLVDIQKYAYSYANMGGSVELPLASIQTQPFSPLRINKRKVDWVKFTIQNTNPTDTLKLVFNLGNQAITHVYQDTTQLGAWGEPVYGYSSQVYRFSQPLQLLPRTQHTYWVHTMAQSWLAEPPVARIETPESHQVRVYYQTREALPLLTAMVLMAGALFFVSLYTIFLFAFFRDTLFAYSVLYTSLAGLSVLMMVNYRFGLGLPLPLISGPRVEHFFGIIPFFFALHIAKLIELRTRQPAIWRVVKILLALLSVQIILMVYETINHQFVFQSDTYYRYENAVSGLIVLTLFWAMIRSKNPLRKYLVVGTAGEFLVYCWPALLPSNLTNVPPRLALFLNYPPFFSALSICLAATFIALAFAYRIYLIELKKRKLQRDYTQQLEQELAARTAKIEAQSRSIEAKNRQQLKTEFDQKLAETEMAALRSQMNPHFIFNCLNSIQYFTARNDAETASGYLTKFSRLIRLVLENSKSEKVTLENELETLRLYIEMEAMRFHQKVHYKIILADEIDPESVLMPPLLLQPFVENAIWHGLMHKEEGGTVQVDVQQSQDNLLHVEITDDGVGRKQAAEYKSKSATKHKSFGLKLTASRIELINQLYHTQTHIEVVDLTDQAGNATGTKVIIEIPI